MLQRTKRALRDWNTSTKQKARQATHQPEIKPTWQQPERALLRTSDHGPGTLTGTCRRTSDQLQASKWR
jgi:hypothetical protein